jgi:hypothetical protein
MNDEIIECVAVVCVIYVCFGLIAHSRPASVIKISPENKILLHGQSLPSYFKAKEKLLMPVRNQLSCSSCWAFSITEMMADTISLKTGGVWKEYLAPQYLMSCTDIPFDCKIGASPEDFYDIPALTVAGVPLEKDLPYTPKTIVCPVIAKDAKRIRTVPHTGIDICADPDSALPGFRQRIIDTNVINMKRALIQYGPICCTLRITRELYDYKGDCIFVDNPNSPTLGAHCAELLGWSDRNANTHEPGFTEPYWIVRNSYSSAWSSLLYGFAYIKMGCNNAMIESRASVCQVEIPNDLKSEVAKHNIWDSYYTSYGEYVSDPERQNFVDDEFQDYLKRLHTERSKTEQNPFKT